MTNKEKVQYLLSNPQEMLKKKPFYRGYKSCNCNKWFKNTVDLGETQEVKLSSLKKMVVSQDTFLKELEPLNHKVLYDQNIPSITMKTNEGGFIQIEYQKMAVSFQKNIKDKQVLHLCGNPMEFTMMSTDPTDQQNQDLITIKQYWEIRNMDGLRTKMVDVQKSVGDAGLLFYFNEEGEIKARILSYMDGYVLCPHNNDNGERILECVYYSDGEIEYIDAYDKDFMYRFTNDGIPNETNNNGWRSWTPQRHGFPEIPLITKRGDVAWNNAQSIIESYEILYNIFIVIQKRHGWGILYIKGKFEDSGRRIAGSVILNDKTAMGTDNSQSDAKFLTPPTPQGTLDTLQLMEETIQKNTSTTFLLPKDIKTSGDISGVAIQLTQSMDIENALQGVIDWQNVASKMLRLFKYGLAVELVKKKIQPTALTDFENLKVNAKFKLWRPQSDYELAQILNLMKQSGFISQETGAETNPVSKPDEIARLRREAEKQVQKDLEKQKKNLELQKEFTSNNNNNKE